MIKHIQDSFHQSFYMKYLEPLTYFLGMEVHHFDKGLILHQHKYTLDLIEMVLIIPHLLKLPLE